MSEPVAVPVVETSEVKESYNPQPTSMTADENSNHLSYKATHGVPYIIDYLGIKEFYEVSEPITALSRQLHTLLVSDDNNETIEETKLKLDQLSEELNLKDDDSGIYKLKKLLALATARQRLVELETKQAQALAYSEIV